VARLIYSSIASLDGYVADAAGNFEWAAPDEEVHAFVNELERPVGTYLYGRRMYETMAFWEDPPDPERSPSVRDFALIWQAADKVVYSRSLERASGERTRIERDFDPAEVRRMKAEAERDLTIGGASLAGQALAAGLVDECQLLLAPVLVGRGTPAFSDPGVRLDFELAEQRRFGNGFVYLRYPAARKDR
jgi:dihydrofolate reductase